jgi:hypothetical protein
MYAYDPALLAAVQSTPQSVADVVRILQAIDATCADGDGLKWFNRLYLEVTLAVQERVNAGGFSGPGWMATLDVRFARFYLDATRASLSGGTQGQTPGCWQALFDRRDQTAIARIQFALAGMNAHINHDLPQAVLAVCRAGGTAPQHATSQYNDFTALNSTLDSLIEAAKAELSVRLLGDALPPVTSLEDTLAAWSISAGREAAWSNAELLWHLGDAPAISGAFLGTLDGLTALAGKTLLVPVPG